MKRHNLRVSLALLPFASILALAGCDETSDQDGDSHAIDDEGDDIAGDDDGNDDGAEPIHAEGIEPPPPTPIFTTPVEDYAQTPPFVKMATDPHRKGVWNFDLMLIKNYPTTSPGAIWAPNGHSPTSDHYTGRAFDWMMNKKGTDANATERARGDSVVNWLLETVDGVPHMRMRRFGIKYVVWYNRIWSTTNRAWKEHHDCEHGGNNDCHRNHIHFSFGVDGADGNVSWWGGAPNPQQPDPANPGPTPDPTNPTPDPGPTDPNTPMDWHIRNSTTGGPADILLTYGYDRDRAFVGDFDGNGTDTPAVFRDGTVFLKNTFEGSVGELEFAYGNPGDIPLAGDWDGDGIDTIGVYRPSDLSFYLRNSNTTGIADIVFQYGVPNNLPVVGDWNGDGIDTIGIYTDGHWYLRNSNSGGLWDLDFAYGNPGFKAVVGDWDGNGTDTVGVVDPKDNTWMLSNQNAEGWFQISFQYGVPGDQPVVGDWNGDGVDSMAVGL